MTTKTLYFPVLPWSDGGPVRDGPVQLKSLLECDCGRADVTAFQKKQQL